MNPWQHFTNAATQSVVTAGRNRNHWLQGIHLQGGSPALSVAEEWLRCWAAILPFSHWQGIIGIKRINLGRRTRKLLADDTSYKFFLFLKNFSRNNDRWTNWVFFFPVAFEVDWPCIFCHIYMFHTLALHQVKWKLCCSYNSLFNENAKSIIYDFIDWSCELFTEIFI